MMAVGFPTLNQFALQILMPLMDITAIYDEEHEEMYTGNSEDFVYM
jgi:hypothetical protein